MFGATFLKVKDLAVKDNYFTKMWHDAMRFVSVQDTRITGNTYIEKELEPGYTHKDFMQFWTNKANGEYGSKNVVISDNTFISDDGETHGIFLLAEGGHGNGLSREHRDLQQHHQGDPDARHHRGLRQRPTITENTVEQYGKISAVASR